MRQFGKVVKRIKVLTRTVIYKSNQNTSDRRYIQYEECGHIIFINLFFTGIDTHEESLWKVDSFEKVRMNIGMS